MIPSLKCQANWSLNHIYVWNPKDLDYENQTSLRLEIKLYISVMRDLVLLSVEEELQLHLVLPIGKEHASGATQECGGPTIFIEHPKSIKDVYVLNMSGYI